MFFVIHIVLVSNLISMGRNSIIADRYAYVASIEVYFLLSLLAVKTLKNRRKLVLVCGGLYFLYFVLYTRSHSIVWENAITIKKKLKDNI